ncbi:hypothetical protein LSM04_006430 [Trypanosoma melophagium]|uniref:uncharacterized protein n=1 Tax=Trypanosoma melophagium TaxID=715481 RepID=UPI00351A7287|nr:hypothetical protein LSM04_006430 [Trypanosoma melophagium]
MNGPPIEFLRPPGSVNINTPPFSSVALQQTPTVIMAQSFTLVGNNKVWVGWSSGHIGVYQMYTNERTPISTQGVYAKHASIRNSKSRNIH